MNLQVSDLYGNMQDYEGYEGFMAKNILQKNKCFPFIVDRDVPSGNEGIQDKDQDELNIY